MLSFLQTALVLLALVMAQGMAWGLSDSFHLSVSRVPFWSIALLGIGALRPVRSTWVAMLLGIAAEKIFFEQAWLEAGVLVFAFALFIAGFRFFLWQPLTSLASPHEDWEGSSRFLRVTPLLLILLGVTIPLLYRLLKLPLAHNLDQALPLEILSNLLGGLLGYLAFQLCIRFPREWKEQRLEGVGIGLCALGLGTLLFTSAWNDVLPNTPRSYMFFALVLWAAMRLPLSITAALLFFITGISFWGTHYGMGPFKNGLEGQFSLLLFLNMMGYGGLFTALTWNERRKIASALLKSESSYRALFESAPEAILLIDVANNIYIDSNPNAQKLFGLSREILQSRLMGKSSPEFQPDGEASRIKFHRLMGLALAGQPMRHEWTLFRSTGETLICDMHLVRHPDPKRDLLRMSLIDITEQKRVYDTAVKNQIELSKAQAIAHLGNFKFDLVHRVAENSAETLRLFGFDPKVGPIDVNALRARIPPDDLLRFEAARHKCLADHQPFKLEHRVIWPNGETRYVQQAAELELDANGNPRYLLGTTFDITDLKRAQEESQTLNRALELRVKERTLELEAANKSLESFAYSVSHDLRAPLRAMDGFSRALMETLGDEVDGEVKNYLERISKAGQRMGELIDDLLSLSRMTRQEMRRESLDLSAMAWEVIEDLKQADSSRKVQIEIEPRLIGFGDSGLARIVLANLIGNAWKFTLKKNAPRIRFHSENVEGEKVLCVADNGAGFNMAYSHKLFGAFQRLHGRREFDGNGIGLAMVQRILARHGGKIWAEGEAQIGAKFYFTFSSKAHG